jgi:hypothetical protein
MSGGNSMAVTGAEELARLLLRVGDAPIEHGATTLFARIAGQVAADIYTRPAPELSDEANDMLGSPRHDDVHLREGLLRCAAGVPIAHVCVLVVTSRVPVPARPALGITLSGRLRPGQSADGIPLGRALAGMGVRREQLSVTVERDCLDETGNELAVRSQARLRLPADWPLALVTELVYASFLAAYPPPWPGAFQAAGGRCRPARREHFSGA